LKQPIAVEFDPSNKSYYVFVALMFSWNPSEDETKKLKLDNMAFTSKGAAQNFYSSHGDPDGWRIENQSGSDIDILDLNPGNPWDAYKVEIHQLLLMEK